MIFLLVYLIGLLISVSTLGIVYIKFRGVGGTLPFILFYAFFSVSFLLGMAGLYFEQLSSLQIVFEALAFLSIYYKYLRKEIALLVIPIYVIGVPFYIISLYLISYDLFVMIRKTKGESAYVVFSFLLFLISVSISTINMAAFSSLLSLISYAILDVGLVVFSMPTYIITFGDINAKVSNRD